LPVIATSHCGAVITEGSDGFLVPTRDAVALAHAILRYKTEQGLLREHQVAALKKAGHFTLTHLAHHLSRLEAELRN
jgi:glycosyltransferase involved in cell wall biosynthesis